MAKKSGSNKKLPLDQSIPLGIQHVLAMFAGQYMILGAVLVLSGRRMRECISCPKRLLANVISCYLL